MNREDTPHVHFQPTLPCTLITAAGANPFTGGASQCPSPCSQGICITPSYIPGANIDVTINQTLSLPIINKNITLPSRAVARTGEFSPKDYAVTTLDPTYCWFG
jgi:hypothetical protein